MAGRPLLASQGISKDAPRRATCPHGAAIHSAVASPLSSHRHLIGLERANKLAHPLPHADDGLEWSRGKRLLCLRYVTHRDSRGRQW